jgi:hypothetical protein
MCRGGGSSISMRPRHMLFGAFLKGTWRVPARQQPVFVGKMVEQIGARFRYRSVPLPPSHDSTGVDAILRAASCWGWGSEIGFTEYTTEDKSKFKINLR